jgi:hypothetical protein
VISSGDDDVSGLSDRPPAGLRDLDAAAALDPAPDLRLIFFDLPEAALLFDVVGMGPILAELAKLSNDGL